MIEELARTGLTEALGNSTPSSVVRVRRFIECLDRLVNQMRAATDTALIYEIQG